MKTIALTKGRYALVDDADFEWLNQWKWSFVNRNAGYAQRNAQREAGGREWIKMHRLITECPKGMVVDHINGNPLDNRRSNLRVCTQQQNCLNTKVSKNSRSGYKDIFWMKDKNRWLVQIMYKGEKTDGGYFIELSEAIEVRDRLIQELHGEFAHV